jgi:hypothetical protein
MTVQSPTERAQDARTEALRAVEREGGLALCTETLATPTEPGRYLEVRGYHEVHIVPLDQEIVHIGRGLTSDLRLEDVSISRRHAILVSRSQGTRVLDDRSSNGVYVNGRRVAEADLNDGDVIALGRVVIRYLEISARQAPEDLVPLRRP